MTFEDLFWELYKAPTEAAVDKVLDRHAQLQDPRNWRPYGQNDSNFGIVENQQASPIPALVEKLINSIDAILMRRCLEEGVSPRSKEAPRSIEEAIRRFFPDAKNWDLPQYRRGQSERIQILADGPRFETSLIIYDDGEGQHPEDFESTFLSLLRGNKTEIHFVQGKYNMGGAGAIAFCGKKRYQLIGSKRFDGSGLFGFTLLRRHPLTPDERESKRATWYEYLVLNGAIPAFPIAELDLGLHNRKFTTGTVIKLYSYDLPAGSRSVISRDLNQSINEYLFDPALPILTVDKPERYPDDRNLQRDLYGLKRRLEDARRQYVSEYFSEDFTDEDIGRIRVTCYVFCPRLDGRTARETRETIQREFFKNNMAVLFSVNGQVHGHYTSEFITRSLKFPLLKDHLLIHVDCTDVRMEFRDELFMASRDRLKDGEESRQLRRKLTDVLRNGRLADIHARRKAAITVDDRDTDELLKSLTRNLPLQSDLLRLLNQTLKIGDRRDGTVQRKTRGTRPNLGGEKPTFHPQRFPSFFKLDPKLDDPSGIPVIKVPLGGSRTIRFLTDVEDQYFDRVTDPGELTITLLDVSRSKTGGGTRPGLPRNVGELLNVIKSSPDAGTIRITMSSTREVQIGDTIKLRAELTAPGVSFDKIFFVKISSPEKKSKHPDPTPEPDPQIGLPRLIRVYKDHGKGGPTWEQLNDNGIVMDHSVVMHPIIDEDRLSDIYVNMDSGVLLRYKASLSTEDALAAAERRYISSVYFHTLFLYMITRKLGYAIVGTGEDGKETHVEVTEYLKSVFQNHYAEFLLNFEMEHLIAALEG